MSPLRPAGRCLILCVLIATPFVASAQLPPPPTPPQNPITEPKRVLGKILFWDEQLSSDNTVACGTCHIPGNAGTDPRDGLHPGPDNVFGTPDDKQGSLGVARMNEMIEYVEDTIFGLDVQVTRRATQHTINAAYSPGAQFWDGRSNGQFVDPETGGVVIPLGGALESQAIEPIMSDVEMGHENRNWDDVRDKLNASVPLALASQLPADMAAAIAGGETYGDLFAAAFGDASITARRIGFAIATYERTLIADQTPWDAFNQGNAAALTPNQQQGLNRFVGSGRCAACHTPPTFSNNTFRNIGLRPPAEDLGRQEVTGNPNDRGRFKVPSLRNIGLKNRFMHTGQLDTLTQVVNFYRNPGLQFPDNRDPLIGAIIVPPGDVARIADFLENGLTDPRVANEEFPFDRPTLLSEIAIGDVNCDGIVSVGDIGPFVVAITTPDDYSTLFPDCNIHTADMNGDLLVTVGDIGLFVQVLTGG